MSERKSRRTSINSVLGAELFSRVATTLSITDESIIHKHHHFCVREKFKKKKKRNQLGRLTWVLNLDSGVGIGVRFVNDLRAHLLCQNLVQRVAREEMGHTHRHTGYTESGDDA